MTMNDRAPVIEQTGFFLFLHQVRSGIRYALYFAAIGFIMGIVYGLLAGLVFVPALFLVGVVGIFCILNFIVSLLAVLFNLLFAIFRKSSKQVFRYFGLSLGFAVVFLLYFYLIHLFKIEVF
jgi:hypothetical protein